MIKKKMKATIIFCILIVFICTGCGAKSNKNLVGRWNDAEGKEMMVFYKDGTYQFGKGTMGEVTGDYKTVSDNEVELTSNNSGLGNDMWHITGIHEFEIDGEELSIYSMGSCGNIVLYRQK